MRLSVIFLAVMLGVLIPPSSFASIPTLPKAPYVAAQEVKQWQRQSANVTFIDVREPKEYEAGHIEGAINIPFAQIETRSHEINGDHPNVFYCISSSWRAPYAANTMKDLGFENIYVLEGGIAAWNEGGQIIYAMNSTQAPAIIPYSKDLDKTLKHPQDFLHDGKTDMTLDELSRFDGQDGRPAYAAVNGVIYDLTQSRLWRGGAHDPSEGKATAGRDLTEALKDSPHGDKHLKDFPVVGHLMD